MNHLIIYYIQYLYINNHKFVNSLCDLNILDRICNSKCLFYTHICMYFIHIHPSKREWIEMN